MSIRGEAVIVGIGETPVDRYSGREGQPRISAARYLTTATALALEDCGLRLRDFDGQGLGVVIPTNHPQPFWPEEAAELLGVSPGLLVAGGQGGASAVSLLGQASAAIAAGVIDLALIVAASAPLSDNGSDIQPYESREFEIPFGAMGPNSKMALVMRRHMHEYGTTPEHFGRLAVAARHQASLNPAAYLRTPITVEDYSSSRMIADPLRLLDCVLPANGGKAFVVASRERAASLSTHPVSLLGFGEKHNPSYGPRANSDILTTGVADAGATALAMAGVGPADLDFLELYDDYVIALVLQLEDLNFCKKGDLRFLAETDFTNNGTLPIQTGGGMINCGQPNTTGGMLHVIEAVRQLRGECGERQVQGAQNGLVTGLGSLPYGKNLGCSSVAVLGIDG